MKPDDVFDRVKAIEAMAGDEETAHAAEDELHTDVLQEIAAGSPYAAQLAREALRTLDLKFDRWYA